jgi:hypothetical protein
MLYAGAGGFCDLRLGVEGNAQPGRVQHREVVCTVADRHGLGSRERKSRLEFEQRVALGLAAEDRFPDRA